MAVRGSIGSVVLAAALVSGCGSEPPDASKIGEGKEAVVFANAKVVQVHARDNEGIAGSGMAFVDTGTPVMVVDDTGSSHDPKRDVWVNVREGEHKGKVVRLPRKNLRPR